MRDGLSSFTSLPFALGAATIILYTFNMIAYSSAAQFPVFERAAPVNLGWYPPSQSWITDLSTVINGSGTYGMRFDGSAPPNHGQYSYCNMEHVRVEDYIPPLESKLIYVEVIHRHHKRTPYASNGFPKETDPWNCTGASYVVSPDLYWSIYTSPDNPFQEEGLHGNCVFPQITEQGYEDSFTHGRDLKNVYLDKMGLPWNNVSIRATNNLITSQVARKVIEGLFSPIIQKPVQIQPANIDSLEPKYSCPKATDLYNQFGPGSNDPTWLQHLTEAKAIFEKLDPISGVDVTNVDFHKSFDHYFDNLSSKQCHGHALPCAGTNCISQETANAVYRLGQWEYSWIYRGSEKAFQAAIASYGAWVSELAQNVRNVVAGNSNSTYRHNIAHDGSMARLLGILQVDQMYWPGMGAELVFEVWRSKNKEKIRVLWSGSVLKSSNPSLGTMDMIDLEVFLAYIDGLVGFRGSNLKQLCGV